MEIKRANDCAPKTVKLQNIETGETFKRANSEEILLRAAYLLVVPRERAAGVRLSDGRWFWLELEERVTRVEGYFTVTNE